MRIRYLPLLLSLVGAISSKSQRPALWLLMIGAMAAMPGIQARSFTLEFRGSLPGLGTNVGYGSSVTVRGNRVHLGNGYGFMAIDVSDPSMPVRTGYTERGGLIATSATRACYAAGNCLQIYDISGADHFVELGACDLDSTTQPGSGACSFNPNSSTRPQVAAIEDHYVYVVGTRRPEIATGHLVDYGSGFLWVVDILDPAHPVLVARTEIMPEPSLNNSTVSGFHLVVVEGVAHVSFAWSTLSGPSYVANLNLLQINVTNPVQPIIVRSDHYYIDRVEAGGDIAVSGNRVHVFVPGYNARIYSFPRFPTQGYAPFTSYLVGANTSSVVFFGDQTLLFQGSLELVELVDRPGNDLEPRHLATLPGFSGAVSVAVSGGFVYAATPYFGLQVFEMVTGIPQLTIQKVAAGRLLISGNSFAQGLPLLSTTTLASPNWLPMFSGGDTNSLKIQPGGVLLPIGSGRQYFRLGTP